MGKQMRTATSSAEPTTVLVLRGGAADPARQEHVAQQLGQGCVEMDEDSAVAVLRTDPFAVSAVVLSGDGGSPVTAAVLESIKAAAPRIPIVFLDERESPESELSIRRTGVHYYSHLPLNRAEIGSVLDSLRKVSGRREAGQATPSEHHTGSTTGKGEERHA